MQVECGFSFFGQAGTDGRRCLRGTPRAETPLRAFCLLESDLGEEGDGMSAGQPAFSAFAPSMCGGHILGQRRVATGTTIFHW